MIQGILNHALRCLHASNVGFTDGSLAHPLLGSVQCLFTERFVFSGSLTSILHCLVAIVVQGV